MSLCEFCQAEIQRPQDRLPEPWFDHEAHRIAGTHVTAAAWRLLEILWRRFGKFVSRDTAMQLLFGEMVGNPPDERIITVLICRMLRPCLTRTPFVIETAYGRGYRLIGRGIQ